MPSASPIKPVRCGFTCIYFSLSNVAIRPRLEYTVHASPLILSQDAEVEKLVLKFVKRLRHEAALQRLRVFSLRHRRTLGDLISIFEITRDLTLWFHHHRQHALKIRTVPFLKNLPATMVNASMVKSIGAPLNTNWRYLFPKVPM